MSWNEPLGNKLSAYADAEFNYIETKDVKDASRIDLGCSGIYMEATIIYFEIKNLSYILKENGRRKTAQVYTMYKEVLTAIAEKTGGFVNCFSPFAFLVVYPGQDTIPQAVRGALKIAHAISDDFKDQFTSMNGLEFAMGLDHGHIMGTKDLSDNGNEHITWFGSCIYKAIRICKECARPFYVGVSGSIYHSLGEDLRIAQRRILGIKKNVEMWTKVTYQYENVKKHLYQTNHKISPEEE
jgi:class 3 adenylate cyclase